MDISEYKHFLKKEYPNTYHFLREDSWSPVFFSESVPLSSKAYEQMEQVVQSLFQLKNTEDYQQNLSQDAPETAFKKQTLDSVLMAYDFHIDEKGIPKLIEVNTNASAFLLVNSFYQFQNRPYKEAKESLKHSFGSEWGKFKKKEENTQQKEAGEKTQSKPPTKTVLIDENILDQKMRMEFFMYKDFFKSIDWPFEIYDSQLLKTDDKGFLYSPKGDQVDFVYNRCTDFYFENHPHLRKAFLKGSCAISPHPREYYLLSDKDRLCEWFVQKEVQPELQKIKDNLLFSKILNSENKEKIWKERKKYFFKNRKGHGGKQSYRGNSISYKKFNELCSSQGLAQEFCPPSRIKDSQGREWKVDFRAYVYEDQIQQLTARCYQGQLTNFRQIGSGFALVSVV